MHIYVLTRGIKHDAERWANEMAAKYLPYKDKNGADAMLQVSVRPIQLWEIVFPEEHTDTMLRTIGGHAKGKTQHKKHEKYINMIRMALGIEKAPDFAAEGNFLPVYGENVEKVIVGVKKDKKFPNGADYI